MSNLRDDPIAQQERLKRLALKTYRKQALQASHDLGYPREVDAEIRKAKTEAEISRIMASARKEKFG